LLGVVVPVDRATLQTTVVVVVVVVEFSPFQVFR
jgi:hypothetical protein